jgi:hypothetical protein
LLASFGGSAPIMNQPMNQQSAEPTIESLGLNNGGISFFRSSSKNNRTKTVDE